ncbi:hypothetical protein T440DRAFT_375336, partial [Plenodomus tracheiphilus IPT5]
IDKTLTDIREKSNASLTKSKKKSATPGKPWKTSFWACCVPFDLCLVTSCCPCFTFGKTWHRVENNGDMTTYEPFNNECFLYWLSHYFCAQSIYQAIALNNMRQKFGLEGSTIEDVLKSGCCPCCALIQAEKESKVVLGRKRTGMDGVADDPYADSAEEKMVMALQGTAETGSTPLNRISEETTVGPARSRAESNAIAQNDDASETTAVQA